MPSTDKFEELVAALKTAAAIEMSSPEDTKRWEKQAEAIRLMLHGNAGLADLVPHIVWHYLADSDVRRNDPAYRKMQIEKLLKAITLPF